MLRGDDDVERSLASKQGTAAMALTGQSRASNKAGWIAAALTAVLILLVLTS